MRFPPRFCTFFLAQSFVAGFVLAQADPKGAEAFSTVSNFAREFCLSADSTSSSTTVEISGDAKVKLNTLIQKIAGLELAGGAKYLDTTTQGVLQKDLAAAFMDTNKCRLRVLEILNEKLLPSAISDPSAARMAGHWVDATDNSHFVDVIVQGQNFHSVEYNSRGQPIASYDGAIANSNVQGSAYLEPTPPDAKLFVVPQRELVDTINMRLSDDATRLLGTFVANSKKMATKIEWVRP